MHAQVRKLFVFVVFYDTVPSKLFEHVSTACVAVHHTPEAFGRAFFVAACQATHLQDRFPPNKQFPDSILHVQAIVLDFHFRAHVVSQLDIVRRQNEQARLIVERYALIQHDVHQAHVIPHVTALNCHHRTNVETQRPDTRHAVGEQHVEQALRQVPEPQNLQSLCLFPRYPVQKLEKCAFFALPTNHTSCPCALGAGNTPEIRTWEMVLHGSPTNVERCRHQCGQLWPAGLSVCHCTLRAEPARMPVAVLKPRTRFPK